VLNRDRPLLGPLLETLFHFRTHDGREVDLVLEDARERVVGLEVKATSTASASDFAGLRAPPSRPSAPSPGGR